MTTPNYQYEKRSRELAKQKKQEAKRQRKPGKEGLQPISAPDQPSTKGTAAKT